MAEKILLRSFYKRDALDVAPELLGKVLHALRRGVMTAGRIVEVEAYLGGSDPASHAYRGVTPRNQVMFKEGGYAYVYFTYGNHFCMNVVTGRAGEGQAVLIRALEPIEGIEAMVRRRGTGDLLNLTSGPGKLTQAMGIGRQANGLDLTRNPIWISAEKGFKSPKFSRSGRIGIREAAQKPYRFFLPDSPFVSRYRPARP